MIELFGESWTLVVFGFLSGAVLGVAARVGRFCTLGALEDWHYGRSSTRVLMWGAALGFSILTVFALAGAGLIDIRQSLYLTSSSGVLAALFGGLTFGIGMALSGNCGYGALARMGGGEMRSFLIVIVMGLAAMAAISGPLAPLRVALFPVAQVEPATAGIAHAIADRTGVDVELLGMTIGGLILAASAYLARDRRVLWGIAVGAAIAAGYAATSYVAQNGFEPVTIRSHTFSAPVGEAMIYVMLSSGLTPGFGIGSVAGVVAGAFLGSLGMRSFRWEACDDQRELRRQLAGAALMGVGAVVAMGCSIGQGLSAFAVLGVTAPVTLASIWVGAFLGLRYLIEGRILPAAAE